jgi:hypothetical protein
MSDAPATYGQVDSKVLGSISRLKSRVRDLTVEVGRIEVHKSRLLAEITHLDAEAARLLTDEAHRLGVPANTPWRIGETGQAEAVTQPAGG